MREKIFTLEGEWEKNPKNKTSVWSMLQFLKDIERIDFFHRRVATRSDFEFYLKKGKVRSYSTIYFAFHGSNSNIQLGDKKNCLSLNEIAEIAKGGLKNKIIHFGSCETCKGIRELEEFKIATGARIVSGYSKTVDWVDSSILDIAYFSHLNDLDKKGYIENRITSYYGDLCNRLGFVILRD